MLKFALAPAWPCSSCGGNWGRAQTAPAATGPKQTRALCPRPQWRDSLLEAELRKVVGEGVGKWGESDYGVGGRQRERGKWAGGGQVYGRWRAAEAARGRDKGAQAVGGRYQMWLLP